jgi:hypothetical protein
LRAASSAAPARRARDRARRRADHDARAHGHQAVELALRRCLDLGLHIAARCLGIANGRHVQHLVANRHAAAKGLAAALAAKDCKRQVLDGEVAAAVLALATQLCRPASWVSFNAMFVSLNDLNKNRLQRCLLCAVSH